MPRYDASGVAITPRLYPDSLSSIIRAASLCIQCSLAINRDQFFADLESSIKPLTDLLIGFFVVMNC